MWNGGNKLLVHVLQNKTELTWLDFYYFNEKKIDMRECFCIIASRYLGCKERPIMSLAN